MAILIKKNNKNIFVSGTGIITDQEKARAERLSKELRSSFVNLETQFIDEGILTKGGVKKDASYIWYTIGFMLNEKIDKYKIRGTTDEPYFWQSLYDYVSIKIQKKPPPKRSKDWRRNHFRLCAKMAEYDWDDVQKVGNWSVWRDLFDNNKLLEDERVLNWVVRRLKNENSGHKEIRPFLHKLRRGLKNTDTSVLDNAELDNKLMKIVNE